MRLYKVSVPNVSVVVNDHDLKSIKPKWLGTQSECAGRRQELVTKFAIKRDDIVTEEVYVPTTKKELLEWLNKNMT